MSAVPSRKAASIPIPSPYWIVACLYQARKNIILATLGGLIIAGIAMLFLTQKYEVSATLLFRAGREQIPSSVTKDMFISAQTRPEDMISKLEMLKSQHLVSEVVSSFGDNFFLARPAPRTILQHLKAMLRTVWETIWDAYEEVMIFVGLSTRLSPHDKIVEGLINSLQIEQLNRSDVVRIALLIPDGEAGRKVVQRLIELFLEKYIEAHKTPHAFKLFESQSDVIQQRLRNAENERLQMVNSKALTAFGERKRTMADQQREIGLQLALSETELARLDSEIPNLQQTIGVLPKVELATKIMRRNPSYEAIDTKLGQLQAQLGIRKGSFEENSRPIIEAEKEIQRLERLVRSEPLIEQSETVEANTTRKRLQEELLSKRNIRAGLVAKRNKLKEEAAKLDLDFRNMEESSDAVRRLDREITSLEQNYLLYRKKLEEIRINEAMDTARISSVSIISPPTSSIRPVKPKKWLILLGSGLAGLIYALGFAFIREAYWPSIRSREQVADILGAPVLARIEEM